MLQQCASTTSSSSRRDIQTYFHDFHVCRSKLSVRGDRSKELTKGLMKIVIKNLKPISVVESEEFCEFMYRYSCARLYRPILNDYNKTNLPNGKC